MNRKFIAYVLGLVTLLEGFMFLVVSLVAAGYKEKAFYAYFVIGIVSVLIGYIGYKRKPANMNFYAREGFLAVSLSWIVISLIGALPLVLTKEIPNYISALFETVSGFTTTGSSILTDVEALSHASLFWRSFTHFFGGMGVLVIVLAFIPSISQSGMYIMKAESPGPAVGKFVSKLSTTARILYLIYTGMTVLQFVILMVLGCNWFEAVNIAFATAGTGGFAIYNTSLTNMTPAIQVVTAVFMLLFGINFNVYYFILIKKAKEAFKCEEMRIYLGIVLSATVIITLNIMNMYDSTLYSLRMAFFNVASVITTTGFGTVDFNNWPTLSKTILLVLMFIGACAGSTGGGIKVSRIAIMFKDCANTIKKLAHPRVVKPVRFEGKPVEEDTVHSIRSYISFYCFILIISVILVSVDNFDFLTCFSAVAATFNNIGPGLGMVGPAGNFSQFSCFSKMVLIFDMLAGRLELIPMLVLFAKSTYRNN